MPKVILRDCSVEVDGVDLSDNVSSLEVTQTRDDVDLTSFGSAMKEHGVGISDASIKLNFYQDFSAGSVDSTMSPIYAAAEPVPIVIKPSPGAVSASNPSFTMQGLLMNYNPLSGSVGDASKIDVTFQNGDPSGIVRDITP